VGRDGAGPAGVLTFEDSLSRARPAEDWALGYLSWCGLSPERDSRAGHDLLFRLGRLVLRAEVKHDFLVDRTGNVALELWNSRRGAPSGLTATRADVYLYALGDGGGSGLWAAAVTTLKAFVEWCNDYSLYERAGDGNARVRVYKKNTFLTPFYRLDLLTKEQAVNTINRINNEVAQVHDWRRRRDWLRGRLGPL